MKLIWSEFDVEIELSDARPTVLTVENHMLFTRFVQALWQQGAGGEESIHFVEKDKVYRLNKDINLIINPFTVDCNEKKIISRIYDYMLDIADPVSENRISSINAEFVEILEKLIQKSPYSLSFNPEMNFSGLLKLYDLHLEYEGLTLVEKLIDYIKLQHQVCNVSVFIFVGLKAYLDNEELKFLYESCTYEGVILLLLSDHLYEKNQTERDYIIDQDRCVIITE